MLSVAAAAAMLSALAAAAGAQSLAAPPGIELSAETFSYDGGTSRVVFQGLKISQKDLSVAADRATVDALDFKRSTWQLRGNVQISVGTAKIASDEALLQVRNNELATVELRGDPATFEDTAPAHAEAVEGHANRLFFDTSKRTLSLTDNAWLRLGANEIMSCDLIFDLDAETFSSGTTDCGERVRIKPAPAAGANAGAAGAGSADAASPAAGSGDAASTDAGSAGQRTDRPR
jgi:lipopolysaccharide transport protein LptA